MKNIFQKRALKVSKRFKRSPPLSSAIPDRQQQLFSTIYRHQNSAFTNPNNIWQVPRGQLSPMYASSTQPRCQTYNMAAARTAGNWLDRNPRTEAFIMASYNILGTALAMGLANVIGTAYSKYAWSDKREAAATVLKENFLDMPFVTLRDPKTNQTYAVPQDRVPEGAKLEKGDQKPVTVVAGFGANTNPNIIQGDTFNVNQHHYVHPRKPEFTEPEVHDFMANVYKTLDRPRSKYLYQAVEKLVDAVDKENAEERKRLGLSVESPPKFVRNQANPTDEDFAEAMSYQPHMLMMANDPLQYIRDVERDSTNYLSKMGGDLPESLVAKIQKGAVYGRKLMSKVRKQREEEMDANGR